MKYKLVPFLLLFLVLSCVKPADTVFFWKCDNSVLYLNRLDTCYKAKLPLSRYDIYFAMRHSDGFTMDTLPLAIEVSTIQGPVADTIEVGLADSLGYWLGKPHVGAYVYRIPVELDLPEVDSAEFSLMPVISEAVRGIDWLALELIRK